MKTKFNQSKLKLAIISAVIVGSAGFSTASYAAFDAATLTIGATVTDSCTMTTSAVTFGAYDADGSSAAINSTGTVTATCTLGGAAVITISEGANAGAGSTTDVPLRRMAGSSSGYLDYNLYSAGEDDTLWGNTAATGLSFTATVGANAKTVYATLFENQTSAAGTYTDNVLVTVTY